MDSHALDIKELNKKAVQLIAEIFSDASQVTSSPYERHLFGSAITPQGFIHYLDTIFGHLEKRYIITGNEGTGKSTLLEKLYRTATYHGYDVEVYHCALIPNKIEHLLIPQLGIGFITSTSAHYYERTDEDVIIDTSDYLNFKALDRFKNDMKEASSRYVSALDRGITYIARAKAAHDELENYYVRNMDFEQIKICRDQIFGRILNYT